MAGVVSGLFPEWKDNGLVKAGDAYVEFTQSMWRALSQAPFSLVDFASLPLTLSGKVDPKNVVGGSQWAEERGLVLPKASGGNPFLNEMGEAGGGMLAPSGVGGVVGPAARALRPPARVGSRSGDLIQRDLGQIT